MAFTNRHIEGTTETDIASEEKQPENERRGSLDSGGEIRLFDDKVSDRQTGNSIPEFIINLFCIPNKTEEL
ncbi:hypothetical protein AYI70_g10582 [Smittium culicis]|uniref:Uncharacterized protein n=1 Tax=Smittium culicis TaxID=133412 RepID=A0A1R1X5V7_9FUNG|nr:hypothetical protein AYI70_g10582 [Smittium culicis]